MATALRRWRFTVDDYHRMAEVGILSEDDRVELLDGEIVEMTPIGSDHAGHVKRLIALFTSRLGARAVMSVHDPVGLSKHSEPQPDVALLRPREDFYARSHPRPEDVLLLIEVADTSVETDRHIKVPLYARAGLREVWLIDLGAERVEVYREPTAASYQQIRALARGQRIGPLAFPDLTLGVDDLLG
ncbi:MAG TPA: Uma2 family endonuclease [Methylomirabilota bacterium]